MPIIQIEELKEKFINALKDYPFEKEEDAIKIGVKDFKIQPKDCFTALESPYSFRTVIPIKKTGKPVANMVEEAQSSEESVDDGTMFYGDEIKMEMDLFLNNKLIVEDCDLTLFRNQKYGLIGRNGIGKSTLLKEIRRRNFGIPKGLKIHLLKQDYVSDERVIDYVGADAGKILQNLGFNKSQLELTIRSLSGGWRMRAQLAKALHINPELLLLDEPTNFLDIKAINFLESQMKDLKTVIVVSHDRNFLNNTVQSILYLNNCKIEQYKGNYSQFVKQKADEKIAQIREYENVKAQREHIQEFIDRFRYNAKRASQAQSRIKLLEKLPSLDPPKEEPKMKLRFKATNIKGELIEIEHVKFSYSNKKLIFEDLNLRIAHNSRIVIVGENGMGKSTLLKMLVNQLEVESGKITRHPSLKVEYFAQHHVDHLDHSIGALSFLMQTHEEEESRAALSNFGLHINNQKIRTLSGGQKSRLALAKISLEKPNLILLDEPTNHLDMETIDALADGLIEFEGAVVCVSHDLAFVEKVFKEVYICENNRLDYFKGTSIEYKESIKN